MKFSLRLGFLFAVFVAGTFANAQSALFVVNKLNRASQSVAVPAGKIDPASRKVLAPVDFVDRAVSANAPLHKKSTSAGATTQSLPIPLVKYATSTGIAGYYDYQSNDRSPRYLYITGDGTFKNLHATSMTATDSTDTSTVSATRHVGYAVSTDGGATWNATEDITKASGESRMGFPCVAGVPALLDGGGKETPVVVGHVGNTTGVVYTSTYFANALADTTFNGFIAANVNAYENGTNEPIWPTAVPNSSGNLFYTATLNQTPATDPEAPIQTMILDPNVGSYSAYVPLGDSSFTYNSGGREATAVSASGKRIGIVWPHLGITDANPGIYFCESTDGGQTFSAPTLVFGMPINTTNPQYHTGGTPDTLFPDGHVDIAYSGETPHIAFVACWDNYYEGTEVWHWSPSAGASRIVATDTVNGIGSTAETITATAKVDQSNMGTISYPTISFGTDPSKVMCVIQATAQYIDSTRSDSTFFLADQSSGTPFLYYQLWAVISGDTGHHWSKPFLVNGLWALQSGDGFEQVSFDYPHLAPISYTANDTTTFNLVYQVRRHPGMFAFTPSSAYTAGPINLTSIMFQQIPVAQADFDRLVGVNDDRGNVLPTQMNLYQNYPNPFYSTTKITYDVPFTGNVRLTVYDMLGREVTTLVDGNQYVGQHVMTFDASTLAGGMYVYVLEMGGHRISNSMVISK